MAESSKKYTLRNTTPGIRGVNTTQGYRDLAPGEIAKDVELTDAEHANADSTGYFEFGAGAEKEPEPAPAPEPVASPADAPATPPSTASAETDLVNMSNEDLANTVHAITGKPAPKQGAKQSDEDYREALLKLARGE